MQHVTPLPQRHTTHALTASLLPLYLWRARWYMYKGTPASKKLRDIWLDVNQGSKQAFQCVAGGGSIPIENGAQVDVVWSPARRGRACSELDETRRTTHAWPILTGPPLPQVQWGRPRHPTRHGLYRLGLASMRAQAQQ